MYNRLNKIFKIFQSWHWMEGDIYHPKTGKDHSRIGKDVVPYNIEFYDVHAEFKEWYEDYVKGKIPTIRPYHYFNGVFFGIDSLGEKWRIEFDIKLKKHSYIVFHAVSVYAMIRDLGFLPEERKIQLKSHESVDQYSKNEFEKRSLYPEKFRDVTIPRFYGEGANPYYERHRHGVIDEFVSRKGDYVKGAYKKYRKEKVSTVSDIIVNNEIIVFFSTYKTKAEQLSHIKNGVPNTIFRILTGVKNKANRERLHFIVKRCKEFKWEGRYEPLDEVFMQIEDTAPMDFIYEAARLIYDWVPVSDYGKSVKNGTYIVYRSGRLIGISYGVNATPSINLFFSCSKDEWDSKGTVIDLHAVHDQFKNPELPLNELMLIPKIKKSSDKWMPEKTIFLKRGDRFFFPRLERVVSGKERVLPKFFKRTNYRVASTYLWVLAKRNVFWRDRNFIDYKDNVRFEDRTTRVNVLRIINVVVG